MNNIKYTYLLVLLTSCASSQSIIRVSYNENGPQTTKPTSHSIQIPKGFKVISSNGSHGESEKLYVYSDSSKLYITDFRPGSLNYNNILSLGDSISTKRFEVIELQKDIAQKLGREYKIDTIELKGKTNLGNWKDIRIGYISIGYINVPDDRKDEFDKALDSFK